MFSLEWDVCTIVIIILLLLLFLLLLLLLLLMLLAVKCQVSVVPEGLRESLSKMMATAEPQCPSNSVGTTEDTPSSSDDCQREAEPPPTEHPYDILSRSWIGLETYVLLLQV